MQVLISAPITAEALEAIEVHHGWTPRCVASIAHEAAGMSVDERKDVAALIVEAEPVDADLIASLPGLEVIACLRSDPVNIDVAAATDASIPVVFSPGRNAQSLADFTLALLLAMLRGVARSHHEIVSGALTVDDGAATQSGPDVIWSSPSLASRPYEDYKGPELSSVVVAVVGYGYMGAAVAGRLAGLVKQVLVVDPEADADRVRTDGYELVTLTQALPRADVISLHARSSKPIIGAAEIDQMKRGSYVINTARATVLDYAALAAALQSGSLRGAALDVYPEEPLRSSSPLLSLPNVTLTPHLAGASLQVVDRQSANLADTLRLLYDDTRGPAELPIANPIVLLRRHNWPAAAPTTLPSGEQEIR